jgi:predicted AAA+ superfamily ATPase
MIARETYFNLIANTIDKPFIKIITGLRRSGKSVLLNLLSDELINRGVDAANILLINFESFEFSEIDDAGKLYRHIKSKITNNRKYYILLDEIQEVSSWEKAINSFRVDFDADIYITGSNSRLLSSELATYLAGRYIEIPVYTLSFREYLQFRLAYANVNDPDIYSEFNLFLRKGGFPALHVGDYSESILRQSCATRYNGAGFAT